MKVNPSTRVPTALIAVAWRVGLDLNPIDPTDPDQCKWLRTLVWPGEGRRLKLLEAALAIARRHPAPIRRGDLRDGIDELAGQAPPDATLVVFHTAVLAYLDTLEERELFGEHVQSLGARWITNEGYGVLPTKRAADKSWPIGAFLLSLNREPVARTDPHGTGMDWL